MANIKDFGKVVTPTGISGNIFSLKFWSATILGTMAFLLALGIGQGLFQRVGRYAPLGGGSIESFTTTPTVVNSPTVFGTLI